MMMMMLMMMLMRMTLIHCIADGSPGLVDAANTVLGWVAEFIGEQPDNPSFSKQTPHGTALSKETAIHLLMYIIHVRGPLTPETYELGAGQMWAGLKAIVSRPGGVKAFLAADGDSFALAMLRTGPMYVKVCLFKVSL